MDLLIIFNAGDMFLIISVLRVGKVIDVVQYALGSLHIKDSVLRLTTVLSTVTHALYLIADHVLLAGQVGIMQVR